VNLRLPSNAASVAMTLAGTWSGTVQFVGSVDGVNWSSIAVAPLAGGISVTSATANGTWTVGASGLAYLCVYASTYSSGTIGVSASVTTGAQAANGPTGGPTSNPVSIAQGGTNATSAAAALTNLGAVSPTTLNNGTLPVTSPNVNGVIEASTYLTSLPTGDIGVAINAAVAALPLDTASRHCGLVTLAAGAYNDATLITKPQCVTIHGASDGGSVITDFASGSVFAVDGDSTNYAGTTQSAGGWENLRILSTGSAGNTQDAFFLGGDPTASVSPSTNYDDHDHLTNVQVYGFRKALRIGNNVSWLNCTNCNIHDNQNGPSIEPSLTNTGEDLVFMGGLITGNSVAGFYNATGFGFPNIEFKAYGTSINDNGDSTHAQVVGSIECHGCHYEQVVNGPTWDESVGGEVLDFGSTILYDTAGTNPCVATFSPNANQLSVFSGTVLHSIPTVTTWPCTGSKEASYSQLFNQTPSTFPYPAGYTPVTTAGQDGIWNNGMIGVPPGGNQFGGLGTPTLGTGYVFQVVPPRSYTIGHASSFVGVGQTSAALNVCIYTGTASANVWNTTLALTGTNATTTNSAAQYTLLSGVPYYIFTGQFGSVAGATIQSWILSSADNQVAITNALGSWVSTSANGTAGSCPATLGTLTAFTSATASLPSVFFGP
jgi:hypothetical protein